MTLVLGVGLRARVVEVVIFDEEDGTRARSYLLRALAGL
jgi:hypothetical protein